MSGETRDPRVGPRSGDVFRSKTEMRRVYGVGDNLVAYWPCDDAGSATGDTTWCTWPEWHRYCATAEIVTVSPTAAKEVKT